MRATSVDSVPITYAQKFIHQVLTRLGPKARLLQLETCVRVRGPIDVTRFERAAAAFVARHPILRSRLERHGGELLQRQDGRPPSLEVVDTAGQPADLLLSALADQPLDLFQDSAFRIVLARTNPGEAYLMLLGHHMFVDARGLQILLADFVEQFLAGNPSAEPPPWTNGDRGYLSFARREQQMVQDGTFTRRAQYWLDHLAGADPALHLPGRGPDPALQSLATVPFTISGESLTVFSDRARRLGVTPFVLATASILHATWEVTAQDDLLLSVATDERRHPYERTVGQFSDLLVIHQSRQRSGTADEAVRALSRTILIALRNFIPFSSFEDRVDWLKKRAAKAYAMTEVNVNFLPSPADHPAARPAGYEIAPYALTARTYPSDTPYHGIVMGWLFQPQRDALNGYLQYESALVDRQVAEAVVRSVVDAAGVR